VLSIGKDVLSGSTSFVLALDGESPLSGRAWQLFQVNSAGSFGANGHIKRTVYNNLIAAAARPVPESGVEASASRSRRHSHDSHTGRHVAGDDGARSDRRSSAHDEYGLGGSIDHASAGTKVRATRDAHIAGNVHAGRECGKILHHDVVSDGTVKIDLDVPAERDIGRQDRTRADDRTFANVDPSRHLHVPMDERCGDQPCGDRSFRQSGTRFRISHGNHERRVRMLACNCVEPFHRYVVDGPASASIVIIDECDNSHWFARILGKPRDLPGEPPGSIDHNASFIAHSLNTF
jgi:hypothetical protein